MMLRNEKTPIVLCNMLDIGKYLDRGSKTLIILKAVPASNYKPKNLKAGITAVANRS